MASHLGYGRAVNFASVQLPEVDVTLSENGQVVEDTNSLTSGGWKTKLVGLVEWGASLSGKIGAVAGYLTTLKKGGTPTAVTGEPFSQLTGDIYQIDTAAKQVWSESVVPTVYDVLDLVASGTYQWTASGSGTDEYYLEADGGGDPSFASPDQVIEDGSVMTAGSPGSLSAGEYGYGDNDTLGFSTLYVRLAATGDPDSQADGFVQGGPEVDSGDIDSFDYLFGKVTFDSGYTVNGTITADLTYIPLAAVAQAQNYDLSLSGDVVDVTDYPTAQANSGTRVQRVGLIEASLSVDRLEDLSHTFEASLLARAPLMVEVVSANGDLTIRGWWIQSSLEKSGGVADAIMEGLQFELYGRNQNNIGYSAAAGLNSGIAALLSNLLARTAATLQYQIDGTDGIEGSAYVSSFGLSGELEGVDNWSADLVSGGALSTI